MEQTAPKATAPDSKRKQKFADLSKLWEPRLKQAKAIRATAIKHGDRIEDMLRGKVGEAAKAEAEKMGMSDFYVQHPKMSSFLYSLIPTTIARDARQMVAVSDPKSEFDVGFAEVGTTLLERIKRNSRRFRQVQYAVWQAYIYGTGALKTCVDRHTREPITRWLDVRDLLLDPSATSAPGSGKWVGEQVTYTIKEARKLFADDTLEANAGESTRSSSRSSEDEGFDPDHMLSKPDADAEGSEQQSKTMFRCIAVYETGARPHDEDKPLLDRFEDYKDEEQHGFEGRDRILYFNDKNHNLIGVDQWPWVLERHEHPITMVRPMFDTKNPWSYAAMAPLEHIQQAMSLAMSFNYRRMIAVASDILLLDKDKCVDPEVVDKALKNREDMVVILAKGVANLDEVFKRATIGGLDPASDQILDRMTMIFDEASNYRGLMGSDVGSSPTATGAEASQQRVQTSVAVLSQAVDEAQRDCSVKELQMALSRMTGEDVAKVVGSRIGPRQPDGSFKFWPQQPSAAEIRRVDVSVEPGSSSFANKAEQSRFALELSDRLTQAIAAIVGSPTPMEAWMIRSMMEPIRMAARNDLPDFLEIIPQEDEILEYIQRTKEEAQQAQAMQQNQAEQQMSAQLDPNMIQNVA